MNLQKVAPVILKEALKYIYIFKTGEDDEVPELHRHLPDGTFDLILNLGDPIYYFDGEGTLIARPDFIFIGGFRHSFYLQYPKNTYLIGVIFKPGFAPLFTKDRINLVRDFVPADQIFGPGIFDLVEQISLNQNKQEISRSIEEFLLMQIDDSNSHYIPRLSSAANLIENVANPLKVSQLAREVCMSERNFRRYFKEFTGYSPHELVRIKRVKRMLRRLKEGYSIRRIARCCGYYDSAHAIRDFQSVAGSTPNDFLKSLNTIDGTFLKQREYVASGQSVG